MQPASTCRLQSLWTSVRPSLREALSNPLAWDAVPLAVPGGASVSASRSSSACSAVGRLRVFQSSCWTHQNQPKPTRNCNVYTQNHVSAATLEEAQRAC